jgi:hypothetical protein
MYGVTERLVDHGISKQHIRKQVLDVLLFVLLSEPRYNWYLKIHKPLSLKTTGFQTIVPPWDQA